MCRAIYNGIGDWIVIGPRKHNDIVCAKTHKMVTRMMGALIKKTSTICVVYRSTGENGDTLRYVK